MKILFIVFLLSIIVSKGVTQSNNSDSVLKIGKEAPELKLPGPNGDTIALSSLRGNIVLIDFWASWCAPCVKEQPALKRLYKKYKRSKFTNAKRFEIYSVSLDSKKMEWVSAIKKMKLNWTHVSDLKYWSSAAAAIYGIGEIPFNVLIDSNGIILALDLHGSDLDKALSQVLKNIR